MIPDIRLVCALLLFALLSTLFILLGKLLIWDRIVHVQKFFFGWLAGWLVDFKISQELEMGVAGLPSGILPLHDSLHDGSVQQTLFSS